MLYTLHIFMLLSLIYKTYRKRRTTLVLKPYQTFLKTPNITVPFFLKTVHRKFD